MINVEAHAEHCWMASTAVIIYLGQEYSVLLLLRYMHVSRIIPGIRFCPPRPVSFVCYYGGT